MVDYQLSHFPFSVIVVTTPLAHTPMFLLWQASLWAERSTSDFHLWEGYGGGSVSRYILPLFPIAEAFALATDVIAEESTDDEVVLWR